LQLKLAISKIITSQIRGEHNAGNMVDSRLSRSGVMETQYENGAHRDNFLRAADLSDNSWRQRKDGEAGSHHGSRLLPYALSADLSARSDTLDLKATGRGIMERCTNLPQEVQQYAF
jgi:hypothetical protein